MVRFNSRHARVVTFVLRIAKHVGSVDSFKWSENADLLKLGPVHNACLGSSKAHLGSQALSNIVTCDMLLEIQEILRCIGTVARTISD